MQSRSSSSLIWAVAAAGLGAGGYYYYAQSSGTPVILGEKAFKGGDQGFISLKLENVEVYNHNVKKLRFALPNENDVSGLPVTSAVITKYKGPEDQKATIRPYTPVSAVDEKGHVDFTIKRYEGGPMSTHLHDMEPGQRLDIKGPIPKYPWEENKHPAIALIAGGTGITP